MWNGVEKDVRLQEGKSFWGLKKTHYPKKNVNIIQTSLGAPKETNCHFPPLIQHPYLARKSQNTFYLSTTTIIYKHSSPNYPLHLTSSHSVSPSSEGNSCNTHQPFGIPEVCSLPFIFDNFFFVQRFNF